MDLRHLGKAQLSRQVREMGTYERNATLQRPAKTCQFGWLQGLRKLLKGKKIWLRRVDLNHRPLGYERFGTR